MLLCCPFKEPTAVHTAVGSLLSHTICEAILTATEFGTASQFVGHSPRIDLYVIVTALFLVLTNRAVAFRA